MGQCAKAEVTRYGLEAGALAKLLSENGVGSASVDDGGVVQAQEVAVDLVASDNGGAAGVVADNGISADRPPLGEARGRIGLAEEISPDRDASAASDADVVPAHLRTGPDHDIATDRQQ